MSEVKRYDAHGLDDLAGMYVLASDFDALAAELASQVAWKERYMREVLQAAERIAQLEAALAEAFRLVATRSYHSAWDHLRPYSGDLLGLPPSDAALAPKESP